MVANTRDRNIDSSRREDSRVGTVDRCEVIRVYPHVAPLASGDKNFNTVDLQLIDRPYEDDGSLPIIERAEVNTIQHDHGRFQGRPFNYRVGDLVLVYWLSERRGIILGALPTDEQEPVCRSQADSDHQEFVFKLCPWEAPHQDPITKSFTEFPDPKHPECYKWWPKTRDSLHIFDCLEGHNTPSCCGQACNSLDDHQSSTCFKNFSDISPTTIDLPRRFKFLHHCGSFWYYDEDGTIHIAGKVSGSLKNQQIFYPSGKILLENVVDSCDVVLDDDGDIKLNPAKTVYIDGDLNISGFCTHGGCSCEGEFAQLEGFAGGQTLCGGTEEDEELTLCGTSDASKGCVKVDADLECTGNAQLPTICGDDQVDGELVLCGTSDVSKGQVTIDADLECNGDLCTQIKAAIKAHCDTIYPASEGVSGGQTICGDTASGGNLTLQSTDHATKGKICLGANAAYDQANDRVGIGTQSPANDLHIEKSANTLMRVKVKNSNTDSAAQASLSLEAGGFEWVFYVMKGVGDYLNLYSTTAAVTVLNVSAGGNLWVTGDVSAGGNLWVTGDVSALSFTDRTPGYAGDALSELKNVINDAQGKISHKTLPAFARAKFTNPETGTETEGRNIGNMVSILTKAVQQLTEKLEAAEKKIAELEAKV
ncbi:hypothetical protein [Methanothrix sp.]|uniref:hypothetical protein n=1 Tax=Methanothrix sp. TaxID=90426 RepID=UPI0032AF7A95